MSDINQMIADAQAREAERQRRREEAIEQEAERRRQEKLSYFENQIRQWLDPMWLELGELRIADDGNPALAFRYQDSDYGLFYNNGINRTSWVVKRGVMRETSNGLEPVVRSLLIEDHQWKGKEQLQDVILCTIARLSAYPAVEEYVDTF
jgi:hypothetical protein